VGMVVPASRLVAFPLAAADSGARAAHDRADAGKYRAAAGKYFCGGPGAGRRDSAAYEPLPRCVIPMQLAAWPQWRVSVLRRLSAVSV
jgi:hypothetical protein